MGDNREQNDHQVKSLLTNPCKMSAVEWMTSTAEQQLVMTPPLQ